MRKISLIFISLFFLFQLYAQAQNNFVNEIYTPLTQEQRLDSLIKLHQEVNLLNSDIEGYRIRIYFESGNFSKAKAIDVKEAFELEYPDQRAYISFNEPYYRVNVGDFRTKIEAIGFLKKIIKEYPNAFEVKDMISFSHFDRVSNF